MVLNDRRIKIREIVQTMGISQRTVFSILHENKRNHAFIHRYITERDLFRLALQGSLGPPWQGLEAKKLTLPL